MGSENPAASSGPVRGLLGASRRLTRGLLLLLGDEVVENVSEAPALRQRRLPLGAECGVPVS